MAVEADQFCLRWNNFQVNISSALDDLKAEEDLVDVTLSCDGQNMKAHKVILSACSPYFRCVFKENPCQHPIVILKNVSYEDMSALLSFMYQGEVYITQDRLASFLRTAELLQVRGLTGAADPCKDVPQTKQLLSKPVKQPTIPKHFRHVASPLPSPPPPQPLPAVVSKPTKLPIIPSTVKDPLPPSFLQSKEKLVQPRVYTPPPSLQTAPTGQGQSSESSPPPSPSAKRRKESPSLPIPTEPCEAMSLVDISMKQEPADEVDWEDIEGDDQLGEEGMKEEPPPLPEDPPSLLLRSLSGEKVDPPRVYEETDGVAKSASPSGHVAQCGSCPHCGQRYSNQSALKYHVRLVHSDMTNTLCCHLCPSTFSVRDHYKAHMWDAHKQRN